MIQGANAGAELSIFSEDGCKIYVPAKFRF